MSPSIFRASGKTSPMGLGALLSGVAGVAGVVAGVGGVGVAGGAGSCAKRTDRKSTAKSGERNGSLFMGAPSKDRER